MNKRGFTLTELLAVIAIIAILSVAAISGYGTMTANSKKKTLETKIKSIENAAYKYAKENNIDKKTTISVNKLVVLGYLQPDETSDAGLSVYNNPVTNENMICNTIDLTIVDNEINVKYNKNKRDCDLSSEESDAGKINVTGYCSNKTSTPLGWEDNKLAWTNCSKVFLRTNPNGLTESNIESISFDYDGNSVTNKTGTITGTNVTTKDGYKNIMFVEAIENSVLTTDVGITYTMKDGKVYFRHVIVRIDQQKPTLTYVLRNDTQKNKTAEIKRDFEVYVDDANGSGSKGFYVTTGTDVTGKTIISTSYKKSTSATLGQWYLTPEDKVGNRGEPKVIRLENIPGELGCTMEFYKDKNNLATYTTRSNDWYNHYFWVRQKTDTKIKNGVNHGITKGEDIKNRSKLTQYTNENNTVSYFYPEYQGNDMEITTFYGGLWNVQNKDLVKCTKKGGIDTEPPVVSFSPNSHSTHKQSHEVVVTITDVSTPAKNNVISGFYTSGVTYTLKYAWAKKGVTPTTWKTKTMTVVNNKTLSATINDRKDVNNVYMTGEYYLWVFTGSVQDKAQNNNVANKSGAFKLDNTPPKCVSSGGITYWVNYDITLYGTCTDQEGETDQAGCVSNISRVQSAEINSNIETPGTVYDKAGNSTLCPKDQHTHIDKTQPNCNLSKSPNVTWTNQDTTVYGTCQEKGSIQSGCARNTSSVVSTGANTIKQENRSPGTVADVAGNVTTCGTVNVNIDKKPPGCNLSKSPNVTWTNQDTTVYGTCDDRTGESGCARNASSVVSTGSNTIKQENRSPGTVADNAGNVITCGQVNVNIDKKPPGCVSSGGSSSWRNSNLTIYGTCDDRTGESGCATNASKTYSHNTETTTASPGSVTDTAGNSTACPGNQTVKIDKTDPSCEITNKAGYSTSGASFKVHCTDSGGSKLKKCAGEDADGNGESVSKTRTSDHTYKVKDHAGNEGSCKVDVQSAKRYIKKESKEEKSCSSSSHQSADSSCSEYSGSCTASSGQNNNTICYCTSCTTKTVYYCGSSYGSWGGDNTGCNSQTGYKAK